MPSHQRVKQCALIGILLTQSMLQVPFRNAVLTHQMQLFNSTMSALRTSMEKLFRDILNYFKFLDFMVRCT